MDNQDAPRKLKLKLFAEQCLERLSNGESGYTDFQAMQDIYIQTAKLSDKDVDTFMDDLFDIFIGKMSCFGAKDGSGDYAVGNQNLISKEIRKKMGFRGFKDTGFPTPFRDGGNQVNHFTAYFVMAHRYGRTLTDWAVLVHEIESNLNRAKNSKRPEIDIPDFSSGFFASKCGYVVSAKILTPMQFSIQMELFFSNFKIIDLILLSTNDLSHEIFMKLIESKK